MEPCSQKHAAPALTTMVLPLSSPGATDAAIVSPPGTVGSAAKTRVANSGTLSCSSVKPGGKPSPSR
jgi:hypothetical protein